MKKQLLKLLFRVKKFFYRKKKQIVQEVTGKDANVEAKTGKAIDWSKYSKKQRRAVKVVVGNRTIPAMQYIDELAKRMPPLEMKDGTGAVDHVKWLRIYYHRKGLEGINDYVSQVSEIVAEHNMKMSPEVKKMIKDEVKKANDRT